MHLLGTSEMPELAIDPRKSSELLYSSIYVLIYGQLPVMLIIFFKEFNLLRCALYHYSIHEIFTDGDDGNDAPLEPRVWHQHGGTAGSRLDQLRERLDIWCRTCPACLLAKNFESKIHHMTDCWRESTFDVIDQIIIMQRYMDRGFGGRGGCSLCGVPWAICQRWRIKACGGWEVVPGQQCQYMWMLVAAVITMMIDRLDEG
jgi:hypothetical protein